MPLTINAVTYAIDNPTANAVTYRNPSSTLTHKRLLKLGRTDAKPTPSNPGVTRAEGKVTAYVDAGSRIDPLIIGFSTSTPVLAVAADIDSVIAEFRALVASTQFVDLIKGGMIYHA